MTDRNNLLDKWNTDKILGEGYGGREKRRPETISQSNQGPYNINQLVYPENLSQSADLQHYVVFYINTLSKTKFKPEKTVNVDVSTKGQNQLSPTSLQNVQLLGGAAAAAGAAATGSLIGKGIARSIRGRAGTLLKLASKKEIGRAHV